MWVFLNNAMVSAVAHRTKPDHLMVRARLKGDLERVFPRARVTRTPAADYLYRCTVTRKAFGAAMAKAVDSIDYPNFKGSIAWTEGERAKAYHDVWEAMTDAQARAEPDGYGMFRDDQ